MADEDVTSTEETKDTFTPPKDGSWIPRDRVGRMVSSAVADETSALSRKIADLESQINKPPQPEEMSTTRIAELVDAGSLSEDEAARIREQQQEQRITRSVEKTVATTLSQAELDRNVSDEIGRYMAQVPKLGVSDSEELGRVRQEFNYLRQHGQPDSKSTELAALRAVYGPVTSLRSGVQERQTHQETGGGESPADNSPEKGEFKLTADEIRYGNDLVSKGVHTDLDQYREQVKRHGDRGLRERAQARG